MNCINLPEEYSLEDEASAAFLVRDLCGTLSFNPLLRAAISSILLEMFETYQMEFILLILLPQNGDCDAFSSDKSTLAAFTESGNEILSETISRCAI